MDLYKVPVTVMQFSVYVRLSASDVGLFSTRRLQGQCLADVFNNGGSKYEYAPHKWCPSEQLRFPASSPPGQGFELPSSTCQQMRVECVGPMQASRPLPDALLATPMFRHLIDCVVQVVEFAKAQARAALALIEKELERHGQPYILGSDFSAADILLIHGLRNATVC